MCCPSSSTSTSFTLTPFCYILALDILGCLPDADCCGKVEEEVYINREAIIEWIYGLQTLPTKAATTTTNDNNQEGGGNGSNSKFIGGGFKGGTFLGPLPNVSTSTATATTHDHPSLHQSNEELEERHPYDHSHLAMTYVALCTLVALGDDLSRIHKDAILQTLQSLQKEDGSFVAVSSVRQRQHHRGAETPPLAASTGQSSVENDDDDDDCDLRFMYTAIVIWYLLSDRTTSPQSQQQQQQIINVEAATSYILSCISYDGALALTPGREGHGGSTFCGIASLYLMGVLDEVMAREDLAGWKDNLIRWCVMRQHWLPKATNNDQTSNNGYIEGETYTTTAAGMQGRPNKLEDTCYSYWIGGTLHLLSSSHVLDGWALREYVLECQTPYGGFGKVLGTMPDMLHSFYSLAWLSLSNEQHCCSEGGRNCSTTTDDGDNSDGEQVSDRVSSKDNGTIDLALDSEERNQANESMNQLSRLDCALGICSKRMRVGVWRRDLSCTNNLHQ